MRIKCAVSVAVWHQTRRGNWELSVGDCTLKVMRSSQHSSQSRANTIIVEQRSSDPETHNPRA